MNVRKKRNFTMLVAQIKYRLNLETGNDYRCPRDCR